MILPLLEHHAVHLFNQRLPRLDSRWDCLVLLESPERDEAIARLLRLLGRRDADLAQEVGQVTAAPLGLRWSVVVVVVFNVTRVRVNQNKEEKKRKEKLMLSVLAHIPTYGQSCF